MSSILSVSQVNAFVRSLVDESAVLNNIMISGEISNFTNHYKSGHLYFSLKDSKSVIKAVMFASDARRLRFAPAEGMKVIVSGRISVYEPTGAYQVYVRSMQPDGLGALNLAFEQLKTKLGNEGLFSRKRPLPQYPMKIAVITSDTGAAVRDIFNILSRRWPVAEINLFPSLVQGEYAENQLIEQLVNANETDADIIIIGRGGGSVEDLWCFNGERLARAVYASKIPVISAVGHETDFTICDFVSDLRAPTPSAAAELAVPNIWDVLTEVRNLQASVDYYTRQKINYSREYLDRLTGSPVLSKPENMTEPYRRSLNEYADRLKLAFTDTLSGKKNDFRNLVTALNALNPLNVISRGYSYVTSNETAVTSVDNLSIGQSLKIRFADGTADAEITKIKKDIKNA